jgi:hypothetical protein
MDASYHVHANQHRTRQEQETPDDAKRSVSNSVVA